MNIRQVDPAGMITPLKLSSRETPHAVLEPNYTCNRRCALCYNRYRDIVKPLATVRGEVNALLAKRNLETISILGGEPTLHPDLPEIVRYVKRLGVYCQILTNGIVLAKEDGGLLRELIDAGIDRIMIHVDTGQGLSEEEVERMRERLAERLERAKVNFGMSFTLYEGREDEIAPLMKRYARFRYFDGILATIARYEGPQDVSGGRRGPDPLTVCSWIRTDLGVEPASYLPSNLDDDEARWLIYFYYLNAENGKTVSLSPAYSRLMKGAYRAVTGRHLFGVPMNPALTPFWFLLTGAVEALLSPRRFVRFLGLLSGAHGLRSLRFQYIVLQSPPSFRQGEKSVEICYHCPDATIRNGRLTPVCLADWISPPGHHVAEDPADLRLAQAVYAHLEEEPLPETKFDERVVLVDETLNA
jgi:hypothetical protein